MDFRQYLKTNKPVIGMLHLAGGGGAATVQRALRETGIYLRNGVDAVLVENYFGSAADCESVLAALQERMPEAVYGVNILGDDARAFRLAARYCARFIQIDSVCGHFPPDRDAELARELAGLREQYGVPVLGGVRFKYQRVCSGRSLEEDLRLGMERCDAVVVTGEGTGQATPLGKIRVFRRILGDFPLVAGAGVTESTVRETLSLCDGAIVGSWFKERHDVEGKVCAEHVRAFMEAAR